MRGRPTSYSDANNWYVFSIRIMHNLALKHNFGGRCSRCETPMKMGNHFAVYKVSNFKN